MKAPLIYAAMAVLALGYCQRLFAQSIVFNISTRMFPGINFVGLTGADARCQERAVAAGLPGTYKAWLSDDTTSASSRLIHSLNRYTLPDGTTIVANNWTDLTDGSLAHGIDADEFGNLNQAAAWTGTNANGTSVLGRSCSNWTSNAPAGATGGSPMQFSSANWTRLSDGLSCASGDFRLYCIQQVPNATVASVTISGRVLTGEGRGATNAVVHIIGPDGNIRRYTTGRNGVFTFADVETGRSYIVRVTTRRGFNYEPQTVSVTNEITDIEFRPGK